MKKLALLVVISLNYSVTHGQLSKIEKKITSFIDANNPEALKLLEEVVNINSGSMNFEGVYNLSCYCYPRIAKNLRIIKGAFPDSMTFLNRANFLFG